MDAPAREWGGARPEGRAIPQTRVWGGAPRLLVTHRAPVEAAPPEAT